jgi:peptidoglycan L-alanyl-D-glutamate endopeptidase CwlK
MHGADVKALQQRLQRSGFNPGATDGIFGNATQAAVLAFQRSKGLLADGVAGPRTHTALFNGKAVALPDATAALDAISVSRMFPFTPVGNIKRNLPFVLGALKRAGLHDRLLVLMALATIRAETESFEPVAEGLSRFNTSPSGHAFDLYDNRADLGNRGKPDGEKYRGRGYIQLTGRHNYAEYGAKIGLGDKLLKDPGLACKPDIAGRLLAAFLGEREREIKEALLDHEFARARRLVNGGSHGLERFVAAYKAGVEITAAVA